MIPLFWHWAGWEAFVSQFLLQGPFDLKNKIVADSLNNHAITVCLVHFLKVEAELSNKITEIVIMEDWKVPAFVVGTSTWSPCAFFAKKYFKVNNYLLFRCP